MIAEEVARLVAGTFIRHGYPYLAVEINLEGQYPTVEFWDDRKEVIVVIACSAQRWDPNVKLFADKRAAASSMSRSWRLNTWATGTISDSGSRC